MSRVVEVPGRELRGEGAGGTVDVGTVGNMKCEEDKAGKNRQKVRFENEPMEVIIPPVMAAKESGMRNLDLISGCEAV